MRRLTKIIYQEESDITAALYPKSGSVVFHKNESEKQLKLFVLDDEVSFCQLIKNKCLCYILCLYVIYEIESFNTLKVPENEEIYKVKLVSSSNGMMINKEYSEVLVSIKENDCPIR